MSKKSKEVVQDERLQAIVLTDSFETRFMPLTSVKPRCLLPLANVPLIEYTLEFLAKAGVDEVYLICCSHADQIQEYIEESKWNKPWSPFKVQTIMTLESRSVGDAMRDIDNRGLITGDFLLVSGDVVTNIEFDKVLEAHKAKRAKDRDHIATMVLTKANALHRTRSHFASFILDKNNKCLYYQDIPPNEKTIAIDPELLEDVDEFVVRNDLIDCHVDICSPHVPAIFQENFDYQYLRKDFVKGILTSDILKKTIYAYITDEYYAARVESWQTYGAVSQDILAGWVYPIVPDANFLGQSYSHEGSHVYKEKNVVLAQSCKIGSCTAIGSNTVIGDGTFIENSVIGSNCKIGRNIVIKNSYVWDGSVINDGAVLEHSIIANNSEIGGNAQILKAVLGFDVKIPENETITTKVSATQIHNDDAETSGGYNYESDSSLIYNLDELNLSDDSIVSIKQKKKRSYSTASVVTDFEEEDFEKEAIATVERALEQNHDLDTALLELNTLRMSLNVTYHEVRYATLTALINRIYHFIHTGTLNAKEASEKIFRQWGPLFKRQVFDKEEEVDLLEVIDSLTKSKEYGKQIALYILSILYDIEIVEEDSILKWWSNTSKDNEFVEKFVNWLEEAEEDSSDEE